MALIQPKNKAIEIMIAINEGREKDVVSLLGLKYNDKMSALNNSGSFLSKACGINAIHEGKYSGGILTTPEDKSNNVEFLTSTNMDINYTLTESVSLAAANSITSMMTLSENIDNLKENEDKFDANDMINVKSTINDGIIVMRDALQEVFTNVAAVNQKARNAFMSILGENSIYTDLISNAVAGANTLYTISKIKSFKTANTQIINESLDTNNISERFDTVLYNTLDLQENLIKMYIDINQYNRKMSQMFTENNEHLFDDVTTYIDFALKKVALPIENGTMNITTEGSEIFNAYESALTNISALYDQYIQDYVSC